MNKLLLVLAFVATSTFTATAQQQCSAKPDQAEAQVSRTYNDGIAHFNAHDVHSFSRQFSDDIAMYTPTGWLRGKAEVTHRFVGTFQQFPKVRMDISDLHARSVGPETVTVDFAWEVFPMGAGPKFKGVGSGVYQCRAGSWVEVLEHETVTFTDPVLRPPSQ